MTNKSPNFKRDAAIDWLLFTLVLLVILMMPC